MPLGTPGWWYGSGPSLMPALLEPAALIWRLGTWLRRKAARPYKSRLPVICIGGLTAGGSGKTPTAIAIARILQSLGERPVFLTRGYGGSVSGPHLVDPERDSSADIGDEPLLLAQTAPTIVSADRAAGARFAEGRNVSVIIMDDGFHNPGLAKDLSFLVVDRSVGIGNGQVVPAGPLREALPAQLSRAQALILIGQGGAADMVAAEARQKNISVFDAGLAPAEDAGWLKGHKTVAFAGIGHPEKFFLALDAAGADLRQTVSFPDHHRFTEKDAAKLLAAAQEFSAGLVTTEKDWMRLQGDVGRLKTLRSQTRPYRVSLKFQDEKKLKAFVSQRLSSREMA